VARAERAEAKIVSLTEEVARQALKVACTTVGLDPAGAELVRIGSNAVFRLREPVIVRITRDGDSIANVRRQVEVARWLETCHYPATRALPVQQPIETAGRVATFWESVSEEELYAPIDRVAEVIRLLHELDAPASLVLPEVQPFAKLEGQLTNLDNVDSDSADFLRERTGELCARYGELDFVLQPGVIHGDANVGNVILDRHGEPVLIDLDSFCAGPREWDLVQTALFYDRFGWHTAEEYHTFAKVYGFDIMAWPGYEVLADYREVAMTLWLSGKAAADRRAASEVRKRVKSIKTGGNRRDWAPF
jgi:aminoglycoside phosphotransferase (APT) family kinase protein